MQYIKISLAFFLIFNLIASCEISNEIREVASSKSDYDTLITLNERYAISFKIDSQFNSQVYTQGILVSGDKEIKKIYTDNVMIDLNFDVSPNDKFVVIGHADVGYVYLTENDSIFHDAFSCDLFELKSGELLGGFQSDCDGKWNEKSQWITPSNELVLDPLHIK